VGVAYELSLLEQMTNANVTTEHTANTVIENTVNNQRKQNKHLGIYIHCVSKKNIPDVFSYNSRKH